ncbi:MAG: DNA double-strand break repair nuclease NurA [Candidatus Caldarchaeum sp.]|nr:DNA double-strand break repair nuclease NurA [Candidatus Caldarchaeum sp.]
MAADEIPDFLKIPKPLQEKFFTVAQEEAKNLMRDIIRFSRRASEVKKELAKGIRLFHPINDDWKTLNVCVVDGSDVPAVDDRIGLRYGLYAVAFKLFKGIDSVEKGEGFFGDTLPGKISMRRESFLKIIDLVTTYYERLVANEMLKKTNPDLVLVDGSFFGYRAGCSMVKQDTFIWTDSVTGKSFGTVYDLIAEINQMTVDLVESGKAVGIIKRVPTAAIDGYLSYKHGLDKGLEMTDRSLLSLLMKKGEVFDYAEIFGKDLRYDVLTWFRTTSRDRSMVGKSVDEILENAERRVKVQLVADLTDWTGKGRWKWDEYAKLPVIQAVRSTKRMFLKTEEDIPPVCLEFSEKMPEELMNKTLAYVFATSNAATGLPIALDLVDELVSLPRGIGKEFVNEIEAELLRRGLSRESLLAVFSRYNPQKDEP